MGGEYENEKKKYYALISHELTMTESSFNLMGIKNGLSSAQRVLLHLHLLSTQNTKWTEFGRLTSTVATVAKIYLIFHI